MRDAIAAGMTMAEARNDARQLASLGESGELFRPRSACPPIVTCSCGVQALKDSPAAAAHELEHGKPR
jgi:hypothetical protein